MCEYLLIVILDYEAKRSKITLAERAFFENRLERKGHFLVGASFLEVSFSFPYLVDGAFLFRPLAGPLLVSLASS